MARNNLEKRQFLDDMRVNSNNPVEALAAIKSLSNMQVKSSLGGMEISMTNNETGEVRTQFISSTDGINMRAYNNNDYGEQLGAKLIAGQDIDTQKFVATVKSIGQDAFDISPAGRAVKLIKRGKGNRLIRQRQRMKESSNDTSYDGNFLRVKGKITRNDDSKGYAAE